VELSIAGLMSQDVRNHFLENLEITESLRKIGLRNEVVLHESVFTRVASTARTEIDEVWGNAKNLKSILLLL